MFVQNLELAELMHRHESTRVFRNTLETVKWVELPVHNSQIHCILEDAILICAGTICFVSGGHPEALYPEATFVLGGHWRLHREREPQTF